MALLLTGRRMPAVLMTAATNGTSSAGQSNAVADPTRSAQTAHHGRGLLSRLRLGRDGGDERGRVTLRPWTLAIMQRHRFRQERQTATAERMMRDVPAAARFGNIRCPRPMSLSPSRLLCSSHNPTDVPVRACEFSPPMSPACFCLKISGHEPAGRLDPAGESVGYKGRRLRLAGRVRNGPRPVGRNHAGAISGDGAQHLPIAA